MMKKIILIIFMIFFYMFILITAIQLTNFSNNLNSENLNFTGNQNITRNLTIYRYANITSAYINLSRNIDTVLGEYNSDLLKIDDITGQDENAQTFTIGNSSNNYTNFYVNNISLYLYKATSFSGDCIVTIRNVNSSGYPKEIIATSSFTNCNNSLGLGSSGARWVNFSFDSVKINNSQRFAVALKRPSSNLYWYYTNESDFYGLGDALYNYSLTNYDWVKFGDTGSLRDFFFIVYGTSNTENNSISVNNSQIWNFTGEFNQTNNKTNDFYSTLNTAINNGSCDCSGCSLSGTNCSINFTFHSDNLGILNYSGININWLEYNNPNLTITSPIGEYSTTEIPYNVSISDDYNISSCIYWVTRGASLEVANTSVSCSNALGNLYVSSQNTNYTFHFFANDTSGNYNYSSSNFSTSLNATIIIVNSPGGGGGGDTTPKIPVIAIQKVNSTKIYSDLQLAIIYAQINSYCSNKVRGETFAIADYSESCSLNSNDLSKIVSDLDSKYSINLPLYDLNLFYQNYKKRAVFQFFATQKEVDDYNLFTSVLGLTKLLELSPASLDKPVIILNPPEKSYNLIFRIASNKPIKECEVLSNNPDVLSCIPQNSTITIKYQLNNTNLV